MLYRIAAYQLLNAVVAAFNFQGFFPVQFFHLAIQVCHFFYSLLLKDQTAQQRWQVMPAGVPTMVRFYSLIFLNLYP